MKILVGGDSWTYGWGVDESERWTSYLTGHDVTNVAVSGYDNRSIATAIEKEHVRNKGDFDLIITVWTSMSRIRKYHFVSPEDHKKFNKISLSDMMMEFGRQVRRIEDLSTPVLHYTVFGDNFPFNVDNYYPTSMLEHLSRLSGYEWYLKIPWFESGMLHKDNEEFTKTFADKYFKDDWKYAVIEREMPMLDKCLDYFLQCGHPNAEGHKQWSDVINERICGL